MQVVCNRFQNPSVANHTHTLQKYFKYHIHQQFNRTLLQTFSPTLHDCTSLKTRLTAVWYTDLYAMLAKANSPNMLLSSLVPTSERTVNFWEHPTGDFAIFTETFGLKYKVLHIVRLSTYSRWVLGKVVDDPRFGFQINQTFLGVSILKTLLANCSKILYTFWSDNEIFF